VAIYSLEEFASYVQSDVDTATATLLRDLVTDALRSATGQTFDLVSSTVSLTPPEGQELVLPQLPATAPTNVKVGGVTVTDWFFQTDRLYRLGGWLAYDTTTGTPLNVEVSYSHGYSTVPGDLKRIALQAAARAYLNPTGLQQHSETIGSETYSDTYAAGTRTLGVTLTAQEKREARRAVGRGGAYTIDTFPFRDRPWWIT
jgi:hypothetical protein